MPDIPISVSNLGKKYRLRHQQHRQRYVALRDVVTDSTKSLARRHLSAARQTPVYEVRPATSEPLAEENFWGLRDVSFEIRLGDCVGLFAKCSPTRSTAAAISSSF